MMEKKIQPQIVNIDPYDCVSQYVSDHELMHALGFFHEHNHKDRDDYLKIHWKNIYPGKEKNFDKHEFSNTYGLPFDWKSAMLYPADLGGLPKHRVEMVDNPDWRWWNALWTDKKIKKYIYYQANTMSRIKGGPAKYPKPEKYSQEDYNAINKVYNC